MIGGYEKVLAKWSHYNGEYLEFISRQLRRFWPKMIIQDANSVDPFDNMRQVPFSKLNEVLLYKDKESYESWQELGADESNENTMLYVIEDRNTVTLVFDDPHHQVISKIIELVVLFNRDYQHRIPIRKAA